MQKIPISIFFKKALLSVENAPPFFMHSTSNCQIFYDEKNFRSQNVKMHNFDDRIDGFLQVTTKCKKMHALIA